MNTNLVSIVRTRLLAAALLGGLLAAGTAPVSAGTPAIVVKYGDLDLTREAGRETLRARLDAAARQLCGDASNADIRGKQLTARCYVSAMDGAIAAVKNPAFAAWYADRTGAAADGVQQIASR